MTRNSYDTSGQFSAGVGRRGETKAAFAERHSEDRTQSWGIISVVGRNHGSLDRYSPGLVVNSVSPVFDFDVVRDSSCASMTPVATGPFLTTVLHQRSLIFHTNEDFRPRSNGLHAGVQNGCRGPLLLDRCISSGSASLCIGLLCFSS